MVNMFESDELNNAENQENNVDAQSQTSAPAEEATDRVNGEYHYKNGYTQKIYSDAHYVREDESAVPPRYYTPPEKPVKEPRKKGNGGKVAGFIAACLVSALLGGIGGASIVNASVTAKLDAFEKSLNSISQVSSAPLVTTPAPITAANTVVNGENGISAAQVYDIACSQVVGISSEVTFTNFFGMSSSSAVSGSGFIISSDGYILTNYHVVEYAYEGNLDIDVMTYDGARYSASIVGVEADNDIAILKIDAEGLNPAVLGDSDSLFVGDTVYAVGNPLGELEFSMTTGHVSAKGREIRTGESSSAINMIQIDAPVNSGNSGGPVYNSRGEVVGIVTAKYASSGVEGIGFAIPVNDAVSIANDIITNGYVTGKAYMGVYLDNRYTSMYSQYYNMPMGAYISDVVSGSCADNAGIQAGDIITMLDGQEISSYTDLQNAVKQHSAGQTVEVEVYRAGESRIVTITFDEMQPTPAD